MLLRNVEIRNFGPVKRLNWPQLGRINLITGPNDSGKTFLLKALYCVVKTLEGYKRGQEPRTAAEILADKLYWTFQADKLGDLVSKGGKVRLSCAVECDEGKISFGFGEDTTKKISSLENSVPPRESNSVFLPAKEVLSLHKVILRSRQEDQAFGFDDTYLDLAMALQNHSTSGKNFYAFADSRKILGDILGGRINYDKKSNIWEFKKSNQKFSIGVTAEGIKKIGILDTLLSNRYLDTGSVVFMDEPEAALHPAAITRLMDIIAVLAKDGVQFFLATHSYFVLKKLFLVAQQRQMSIPVISASGRVRTSVVPESAVAEDRSSYKNEPFADEEMSHSLEAEGEVAHWTLSDLLEDRPRGSIIDESIRLYEEEVEQACK